MAVGQAELHAWIATQEENTRIIAVPRMYIEHLGHKAALLLSQMLWWAGKMSNEDGKFYHTEKEWQDELVMSRYEVRAATDLLERKGLIRRLVARKPGSIDKVTWYQVVVEKITGWWKKLNNVMSKNCTTESTKTGHLYISKKEEKEEGKEEQAHSANGEPGNTSVIHCEEDMAFPKSTKGKNPVSADEVKSVLRTQSKDPLKEAKKEGKLGDVIRDWKRALAKYHMEGEFVGDPKHSEKMALNSLIKKCDAAGVSGRYTLVYAVKEWIGFAKYVQLQRGLANVPIQPTISFLVFHAEDAIRFVQKETQTVADATPSAVNCTVQNKPSVTIQPVVQDLVSDDQINKWKMKLTGKG